MSDLLQESADEYRQRLNEGLRRIRLQVFLCGETIDRSVRPRRTKRNARLRHDIMQRLEDEDCVVVLGEDKEFYTAARDVLAQQHDIANQELALADHADLTVIFPCSAGSFAEIGMFALLRHVGPRLVIVVDDRDGFREGYIAKGPVLMAEKNNAQVAFISYENIDDVWAFVGAAVDKARIKEWERGIISGR